MYLLSFVNQILSPSFRLLLYNSQTDNLKWIGTEQNIDANGVTGILEHNGLWYLCFQNGIIGVMDQNQSLIQKYITHNVIDPHSIMIYEQSLLVVSSGTNTIVNVKMDSKGLLISDDIFWKYPKLPSYEYDYVHINSILSYDNEIYITAFGQRTKGDQWDETQKGLVMNITTNQVCLDQLSQPHSLFLYKNQICLCNSLKSEIIEINGNKIVQLQTGYIRGAIYDSNLDKMIYVINSRRKLKKTNFLHLRGRVGDKYNQNQQTTLVLHGCDDNSTEKIPISDFGDEVYDIRITETNFNNTANLPQRSIIPEIKDNFHMLLHEYNKQISKARKENSNSTKSHESKLNIDYSQEIQRQQQYLTRILKHIKVLRQSHINNQNYFKETFDKLNAKQKNS